MLGAGKLALSTEIIIPGGRNQKNATMVGSVSVQTDRGRFSTNGAEFNHPLYDSATAYIDISPTNEFAFGTGDFTIECWFRPTTTSGTYYIFDLRPNGVDGPYPAVYISGTRLYYYANGANQISLAINSVTSGSGIYYHLALCRRNGVTTLYLRGNAVGSITDGTNYLAGGCRLGGTTAGTFFYNGFMDNFRISPVARYRSSFDEFSLEDFRNDTETSVLLNFNELDNSTIISDSSLGEGHQSQAINAYGIVSISTTQTKFGNSVYFNSGANGFLRVDPVDYKITNDFTIEGWIYPDSINQTGTLWLLGTGTTGQNSIYIDTSLIPYYSANGSLRITGTAIASNAWTHIAVSRSGANTRLFINGLQVGTTYVDSTAWSSALVYIGSNSTANYYRGWLDDFRISNVARYTTNFSVPTTAFVDDNNTRLLINGTGTFGSAMVIDEGVTDYPLDDVWISATQTSTASTISVPSAARAGDWAILFDRSTTLTSTVPSGFTTILTNQTTSLISTISYKQLTNSDINASLSGQGGTASKILICLRTNKETSFLNTSPRFLQSASGPTWAGQATDGVPPGGLLAMNSTRPPVVAFISYSSTGNVTTRGSDVTATAEYSPAGGHHLKVFVYGRGSTTTNINYSQSDNGSNILQIGAVRFGI